MHTPYTYIPSLKALVNDGIYIIIKQIINLNYFYLWAPGVHADTPEVLPPAQSGGDL